MRLKNGFRHNCRLPKNKKKKKFFIPKIIIKMNKQSKFTHQRDA